MRLAIFAAVFALLAGGPASAQMATVEAARIHDHGTHTRVVFDLSRPIEPLNVFTLAAEAGRPYRVVIDLPEVIWSVPEGTAFAGAGLIDQVRYGRNRPGRSRIVLDLPAPAAISDISSFAASAGTPARLVMDLAPEDTDAFIASSGFPVERAEPMPTPQNDEVFGPPAPPPSEQDRAFQDIESVLASLGEQPATTSEGSATVDVPERVRPVIVIDPGHGGRDPGMMAVNGTPEKTIVLDISRALRDALIETDLFDVYLTRNEDILLPLNDRYAVAQDLQADLFISVHVDSNDSSHARGVTVYTLSEDASDEEAARVAERENQSDAIAGYEVDEELTRILIDLAQRETMNLSAELAMFMVDSFSENDVRTVNRPHRFAGFRVLTAPDVPSILLETGFGSNRQDAALLISEAYHRRLSRALAEALIHYFELEGAGGAWLAQNAASGD